MSSKAIRLKILETQISACRQELHALYECHGYIAPEVLAVGVKMDKLLNKYYKLSKQVKIGEED